MARALRAKLTENFNRSLGDDGVAILDDDSALKHTHLEVSHSFKRFYDRSPSVIAV